MSFKYYLILFEINFKLYNKTKLENIIIDLKKKNYNFIYGIITNENIKIQNADIIYVNDSKYCFNNIIKSLINNNNECQMLSTTNGYLDIDYIIHIKHPDLIDYSIINTFDYDNNKITISNDYNNICCRIIPYNIIKSINHTYYNLNKEDSDIIYCIKPNTNIEYNYISNNENTSIKINTIKSNDLITIIMTSYNSENTITNAIRSIINQTYTNIEFIIVDDGSYDNTPQIIRKYTKIDKRITFIELNVNKGCYYAKNIGLKHINKKTKYIAFQDSDDISHVSRIAKQYKHMKKNKLLLSTVQFYENNITKMPMISKMINIIVFNNIGYFGNGNFGEDEHYYYRFFALFCPNYDWNKTIKYQDKIKKGFFKDYKFYQNINEILYIVTRHENSLTAIIKKPRPIMSSYLNNKYKKLSFENTSEIIKNKCYIDFNDEFSIYIKNEHDHDLAPNNFNIFTNPLPIYVKQGYISKTLSHLKERFLNKYNLTDFNTFNEPCIFFGIYNNEDISTLKRVKKDKYIIWGGTDLNMEYPNRVENLKTIKLIPNIKNHFAISSDIEDRMIKLKLNYKRISFNLLDENSFYPITLPGNNIFIYNGITKGNEYIYNDKLYKNIQNKLPQFNYIYSNTLNLPYEKMADIYKKCFIGLRLTKNDGNANMVQEMTYMNIPVVHNGDEIKSLSWKTELDIINHIKISIPSVLIIFEKNMMQSDGSTTWLFNFIKLIQLYNSSIQITIKCMKINKKINLNNVDFITICDNYSSYNHIFYRFDNKIIDFNSYDNTTLIIHKYDKELVYYYNKFKFIICNSVLIKDEIQFNNSISQINILPPLIKKISKPIKNNKLTFCYCGTIKKSYKILEMLEIFHLLSNKHDFIFYLIYGKHKLEDEIYDKKLNTIINKLKTNKKFNIQNNIPHNEIENIINLSHYGIVIHDESIDNKQQSTKLIEYLSFGCIPISYLTYLNCNYIDTNLHFTSIKDLNIIIENILNDKINYNSIEINDKINNHLFSNNLHIFDVSNNVIITDKILNNCDKIIITNVYKNFFYNKKVIYINDKYNFEYHSNNIKKLLNNDKDKDNSHTSQIDINFNLCKLGNYELLYNNKLFDFNKHPKELELYGVTNTDSSYLFNSHEDYLEFNCYSESKYCYYVNLNVDFVSNGTLFILGITDINGIFKDVNRNLHFINNDNNNITFSINTHQDADFIIKIKPSARKFSPFKIKIKHFDIIKLLSPNELCSKIKIINMDKEYSNYHKVQRTFEINGINCERSIGIDGQNEEIQNIYNEYCKKPFNEIEQKIKRKLIVSTGAFGYLYSMMNIFKEAIINNYEYIMICDDDVKLINNFLFKFNDLLNSINHKFRLLMLGSSQWEWDNIQFQNKYYYPNSSSNGSFANIYHRSTFDNIYKHIQNFDSPFDSDPMKSNFINNNCYTSYPNLIITQLETSNIRKINNNRSYIRFKWDTDMYLNYQYNLNSKLIYKKINKRINKQLFIIGITTFNRLPYLKECISSLFNYLSNDIDYILILADGNSSDGTQEYIKNLSLENNISLYLICNYEHFIYRQSNSILSYSNNFNFDYGFLINDDIIFLKSNWDTYYYNTSIKSKYDHLVFYDINHKKSNHIIKNNLLISYCDAMNCQGAFFTFTKELINKVGYFDEHKFKIRGHSHIDYTIRCCRNKFNNENKLYDALESHKYIKLNINNYVSSFNKLPLYLRELYKVTLFELEKRLLILKDKNRNYIKDEFIIESD